MSRQDGLIAPLSRRDFLRVAGAWSGAALLAACSRQAAPFEPANGAARFVRLLYTNDEHGWMEIDRNQNSGGAVSLMQRWSNEEGYTPGGPFLVLSGGDLFTGPALSSQNHGEAMVDVMNAMGYQAAAVGNHDFDYGLENLRQRAAQANFPLLSANLRRRSDGQRLDFIQPFTVKEVNGIKFGLIGLTTTETAVDTRPEAVADLEFLSYRDALQEVVPQAQAAGAQMLVVLGHICTNEMIAISGAAQEMGIRMLCGGHCHEVTNHFQVTPVRVQSGSYLRGYMRIDVSYNVETNQFAAPAVTYLSNPPGKTDPALAARVQSWRERADPSLWQVIGYLGTKIDNRSAEMGRLIAAAWLAVYPQAQIVMASPRYIHSIPAGEITRATVLSTWPTDNTLVHLRLSGRQVMDTQAKHQPVIGGSVDLETLDPEQIYDVLLPDALYQGGNYYEVSVLAPDAQDTGIPWREPLVSWIEGLGTTRWRPLERYLE